MICPFKRRAASCGGSKQVDCGGFGILRRIVSVSEMTGYNRAFLQQQHIQKAQTAYRSETIDGIKIAYREAGDPSRPTILLLHGFPTSSRMFRNLIPALAKKYHAIAPDYPGFGASDMPQAKDFEYSFGKIAGMMTTLLDRKTVDCMVNEGVQAWYIVARKLN